MYRILKLDSILVWYNNNLYDSYINYNINYFYNIGSLLGLGIFIQIISGILLSIYYISLLDDSFYSIYYITQEVRYGYIVRYIHIIGVSYIFILLYLHIYKGIYYGSYIYPRNKIWIVGVFINILLIIISFLGYSIAGGDQSYWGIVVICNILTVIPYINDYIIIYIWGNYNINNDTINRLYSFHYLLGISILVLIICHIIYLHEVGGNNIIGINSNTDLVAFHIYYSIKDLYTIIIYILLLLILVYISPHLLSDNDNNNKFNSMVTPISIVPHWYLLGYYCILRSYSSKIIGVIFMAIGLLILFILPYNNTCIIRSSRFKYIYRICINSIISSYIVLIYIGGLSVNSTGIIIGKLLSIYYILSILIILPIVGILENIVIYHWYPVYIYKMDPFYIYTIVIGDREYILPM